MAVSPTLKKAYWSLAAAGAFYFVFITILLNGWTQRQALYLHWVNTKRWHDPNTPEQFGYLKNQVRPFHLSTPDNIRLYGWHILPLALYTKHESALLQDPSDPQQPHESSTAFKLLANDPNSRLVISFHGNAGTIAQGWRTDGYRALSTGSRSPIHVLTIDYRGFGFSAGSPTEAGLVADGIALVDYALRDLGVPAARIVVQGHSLGTAVAVAVAEHFALKRGVQFRGLVLVAPFEDIPALMLTYAVGGVVPILSPLRPYPMLQRWFAGRIQESWRTGERLEGLVRGSEGCRLFLVHSRNDFDIPWSHAEKLFRVAVNATAERGMGGKEIDAVKWHTDLGRGGWRDEWKAEGREGAIKYVRLDVVPHGGHNRIVTYPVVSKAIVDAFDLVE